MNKWVTLIALACAILAPRVRADEPLPWTVGVAKIDITPTEPTWMAGYASRNRAAEGTAQPLWAKALAVTDAENNTVVLVSAEVIGLTREIGDEVAGQVESRLALPRSHLVLASTHTHSGPVVASCAGIAHRMDEAGVASADRYQRELTEKLVRVIVEAHAARRPARLYLGESEAHFAVNRRLPEGERIVMKPNPDGPVDPTVPVLVAKTPDGEPMAILFGYACHNTTLDPQIYLYNGDYAGFAQATLQQRHPTATAMFLAGCGADANPIGRSAGLDVAQKHGRSLADAVDRALGGDLREIRGPLRVALKRVDLPLVDPPDRETLTSLAQSKDVYRARLAQKLLGEIESRGQLPAASSCPVQVVRFGKDWALVALGGEVVVDYALRLKKELADRPHWTAGYCNEVFGYVPSERVLAEGGYEAEFSQIYFGWHGPYRPGLEAKIVQAVKDLMGTTEP